MTDAAYLLWSDAGLERRRCERSASALVAVQSTVLEDVSLPGRTAFLQLYDLAERADPAHFTRVWHDPAAYHWVRRAVHLLAGCRGAPLPSWERAYCAALGTDRPQAALELHLREFGKFILAISIVAGIDVEVSTAYDAALPHALPGTDLALTGRGHVRVHGLSRGRVAVTCGGTRRFLSADGGSADRAAPADGPRVETCPSVGVGQARVVLNPATFHLPGLGLFGDVRSTAFDFQERHAPLVAAALRTLQRLQPSTFARFADTVRTVALKPAREEDFGTLSTSELPSAFVCSVPADPLALAADFVHELHHGRLFAIEEAGPFFESGPEDAIEDARHYSPWRDAPRPLHGLLHAVCVYLPVFHLWSAAFREGALDGPRRDFARDQLARIPVQLRIGVNQLRRHAQFTPLGRALFEEMIREAAGMEAEAAALGATADAPAFACRASGAFLPVQRDDDRRPLTVAQTLLEHLARYDLRDECAKERDTLARRRGAS